MRTNARRKHEHLNWPSVSAVILSHVTNVNVRHTRSEHTLSINARLVVSAMPTHIPYHSLALLIRSISYKYGIYQQTSAVYIWAIY